MKIDNSEDNAYQKQKSESLDSMIPAGQSIAELVEQLPWNKPAPKFESPAGRQMSRFDTAQGSYGKTNEPRTVTVAELFDEVKSDQHKAVCDFLRSPEYQSQAEELDARHKALIEKRSATQDSAERAKIDAERDKVKQALTKLKAGKHKLPAVTFSTICKGGHGLKNAVSHSGIYQCDLDLKDNLALADKTSRAKIRRTLDIDPRVLGFFDSPSNGLKVLVLVNSQSLETRAHEHAWKLANEYVCDLVRSKCGFDLVYDDSCKNPTRLCFLSHDPEAQLDELAVPLEYTEPTEPAREEPRKAHELQHAPQASGSSAGLKPMEAYNQSSDFEELLRQLGATKTKCGGWLRTGGTSPRSASWSGKSLYVFSDSFAPFDQNTSYTPADIFAVCVLGLQSASEDQALVVRELSKLGYGEQGDTLTDDDLASIKQFTENFKKKAAGAASTAANEEAAEEVEAEPFELGADARSLVDDGVIEEEWATRVFDFKRPVEPPRQKPVGRLNSILRAYERRSRLPQTELYLTSAIVTAGALLADEVETRDGAITSLFAMGIGPSSSGKNASCQTPHEILRAIEGNETQTIIGKLNSSVALESLVSKKGRRMLSLDEAGHQLAAAKNDSHMSRVAGLATELWNGNFTPGSHADCREVYNMEKPRLSIWATGSPDRIADALDDDSIRDGCLPRYLFATARSINRREQSKDPEEEELVMEDLKRDFRGFFYRDSGEGDLVAYVGRSFKASICARADALIKEFSFACGDHADELSSTEGKEFWYKGAENVKRVALIQAAMRAEKTSRVRIEVQDVIFAIEVVLYSIKSWAGFISSIGKSPRAKALDEILELIASQPMGIKKAALNGRFYRKLGNDKLMDYINDLLRAGKIDARTGPRGGAIYVAINAD